jgi:hypothetical protein
MVSIIVATADFGGGMPGIAVRPILFPYGIKCNRNCENAEVLDQAGLQPDLQLPSAIA